MDFFTGKEIEVPEDVKKLLQSNEQIILSAQQAKSTSLINPNTIFITTQRVIVRKPTSIGSRKNIEDYRFTDIANVQFRKGIIRSGIVLKMRFLSDNVEIDNFPNEVGEKIFKLVDDGVSGRLIIEQLGQLKTPSDLQQEIINKIKELAKLREQGILSETEFQKKKIELLKTL